SFCIHWRRGTADPTCTDPSTDRAVPRARSADFPVCSLRSPSGIPTASPGLGGLAGMQPASVLLAVGSALALWAISACNDGTDFRGLGADPNGADGDSQH